MRMKLTLRMNGTDVQLPLSYYQAFSDLLRGWLGCYGGVKAEGFVFSRLLIKSKLVDLRKATIRVLSPTATLYVGFNGTEESAQALPPALDGKQTDCGFFVQKAELLPLPRWTRRMSFRMLSPLAVPAAEGGWLAADDPRLSETIQGILVSRHGRLKNAEPLDDQELSVLIDASYIEKHGGTESISKNIIVRGKTDTVQIIQAFLCPVTLLGNPALISLAYDTGLGALGSLGFGMVS